jgi:hypothetical protein
MRGGAAQGLIRTAGALLLVLGVAQLAVAPSAPVERNVPGFSSAVIGLELASRPEHVLGILGSPGTEAHRTAARGVSLSVWIDFPFALAYAALYLGLAAALAARRPAPPAWTWAVYVLAAVMAVGDWLENRELLRLCGADDPAGMDGILGRLRAATLLKWHAIHAASAIVAGLMSRERRYPAVRWNAAAFGAAAALGFASVVHLPAIEYGALFLIPAWTLAWILALRGRWG